MAWGILGRIGLPSQFRSADTRPKYTSVGAPGRRSCGTGPQIYPQVPGGKARNVHLAHGTDVSPSGTNSAAANLMNWKGGGVPLMVSSNNASRSADKIEQSTIHRPLAGSSCCQASASPSFERGPAGAHAQKNSTVQTKQDENGKRRREQRSRPPSGSARSPTQWVNAVATRPPPPLPYRHTGRHRVVERMSTSRVHPSVCSPAARRSRHGEATT